MTKQEILEVLYEMKIDFEKVPVIDVCKAGFCRWLIKYWLEEADDIIAELRKDKPVNLRLSYWYDIYKYSLDYEASITPRIDHLNHTIARLEKELKIEKQNASIF